jgi:hypothetical protein
VIVCQGKRGGVRYHPFPGHSPATVSDPAGADWRTCLGRGAWLSGPSVWAGTGRGADVDQTGRVRAEALTPTPRPAPARRDAPIYPVPTKRPERGVLTKQTILKGAYVAPIVFNELKGRHGAFA